MPAIITGNGLGVERGSANILGSRGQLGTARTGQISDNIYVNAATGNLVVTQRDEFLVGRGPDSALNRVYNSLGQFADDNGDNWRMSVQRRVIGSNGAATVKRIDWDGSETVFALDGDRYVSKEGAGAYDTLRFDAGTNQWTWTDGNSQVSDIYDGANGGRIVATRDLDGNQMDYRYNAGGQIDRITTANGDYTDLVWSGNNITKLVTSYTDASGAKSLTRTYYEYDGSNRLASVKVDLNPNDNEIPSLYPYGRTVSFDTSYTYNSITGLISGISQSDGTQYSISYQKIGTEYRVSGVQQKVGSSDVTTSFAYDIANRTTTVIDGLAQVTKLAYDAQGQLIRVTAPAPVAGGNNQITEYSYNANGDVLSSSLFDGQANYTAGAPVSREYCRYDANGNRIEQADLLGNTVRWTYGANSEILTETHFVCPDSDGAGSAQPSVPLTTRCIYDDENHLRFVISPEGRVTEYLYDGSSPNSLTAINGAGLMTSQIDYAAHLFPVSDITQNASISEASMVQWRTQQVADKSAIQRVDTVYDYRGNVASITSYSQADSAGNGLTNATHSRMLYIYDQAGNLLSRQLEGSPTAETFVYDGLGRVVRMGDLTGSQQYTTYEDSLSGDSKVTTVRPDGSIETSTFRSGALQSSTITQGNVTKLVSAVTDFTVTGNPTITSDGLIDGLPATRITPAGNNVSLSKNVRVKAGDTIIFSFTLQPQNWNWTKEFGLEGALSGLGTANDTTVRILSGPASSVMVGGDRLSNVSWPSNIAPQPSPSERHYYMNGTELGLVGNGALSKGSEQAHDMIYADSLGSATIRHRDRSLWRP